jgi:hypothetical protein
MSHCALLTFFKTPYEGRELLCEMSQGRIHRGEAGLGLFRLNWSLLAGWERVPSEGANSLSSFI